MSNLKHRRGHRHNALFGSMCDQHGGLMAPPQRPRVALRIFADLDVRGEKDCPRRYR